VQCPECREELVILEVDGVELDLCYTGHGSWFDAEELSSLFEAAGLGDSAATLESELAQAMAQNGKRRCPRCGVRMQQVRLQAQSPLLDRCPGGHGLWFDPGELSALASSVLPADSPALRLVHDYLARFFPNDATASAHTN